MIGTPYTLEYVVFCEIMHFLFALLWASVPVALISIIWCRGCRDRRIYGSLLLLGLALGCTSHYLADVWQLGF
jgi:hypothetical protein